VQVQHLRYVADGRRFHFGLGKDARYAVRMRTTLHTFALLAVAVCTTAVSVQALNRPAGSSAAATQDGISVYFRPKGGCTDAIVE
jgi:hypothetical protein